MKRSLCILLAALMLASVLGACSAPPASDPEPDGTPDASLTPEPAPSPDADAEPSPDVPDAPGAPVLTGAVSPADAATIAYVADGFAFTVPAGAENVSYSLVSFPDGSTVPQMDFTYNGSGVTVRALAGEAQRDLSGIAGQFANNATVSVFSCLAGVSWEDAGVIVWADGTRSWCVYMDSGADSQVLASLASQVYILPPEEKDPEEEDPQPEPGYVEPSVPEAGGSSAAAQDAAALAQTLIGAPYQWGGVGPDTFDNSGFVFYCFDQCGVSIPRTTAAMYAAGSSVGKDALEPGDVLFFSFDGGAPSYVGIYLGGGQFISESNENSPVGTHDFTGSYYQEHYMGARRF